MQRLVSVCYAICIFLGSTALPNKNLAIVIAMLSVIVGWHYIRKGFNHGN
jgi:hypothetical protein